MDEITEEGPELLAAGKGPQELQVLVKGLLLTRPFAAEPQAVDRLEPMLTGWHGKVRFLEK